MPNPAPLPALSLRRFGPQDFGRLSRWIRTPFELMVWGGARFRLPLDQAQLNAYLQPSLRRDPARRIYTAEFEGEPVGHAELNAISSRHGNATLCRVLVGESTRRGQGLGAAMVTHILDTAFGELKLHRVDLNVYAKNAAAIACYQKLGFVEEGVMRQARRFGDEWWDIVHMSILEREWDRS